MATRIPLPGVEHTSKHGGSRSWWQHRPGYSADIARSRAHAWSIATGRPLPPAARIRTDKVSNAVPMSDDTRLAHYGVTTAFGKLTPRQARRLEHKRNHLAAAQRRAGAR